MNRFDFGVILATVLIMTAAFIIRNVVVPIVRLRVDRSRSALSARDRSPQLSDVDQGSARLERSDRDPSDLQDFASSAARDEAR